MADVAANRRLYSLFKVFCFISFLVLLLFVVKFVVVSHRIADYRKEMAVLQSEIDKSRQLNGIDQLETEWSRNYNQMLLIEKTMNARTNLTSCIDEIARLLPQDASLQDFKGGRLEENGFFLGVVVDSPDRRGLELINNLISDMSRSPLFNKNVKLDSQERMPLNNKEVEVFKISVSHMVK
jgi:Tfp pilus assembly protein PilN